ncbi:YbaB/EbfC family nucleoid-associated protein [Lentzea sp. PSKA42]|uniref:YbaB/EbfC family nucleoid-associated protein n=1 Tax=Lentzea indica TaxID=2604800 RepID=A0ABX1FZM6_9PSEU|nr:YbaB/EbfC family nucleoid-associated protein [Lentzea indica]
MAGSGHQARPAAPPQQAEIDQYWVRAGGNVETQRVLLTYEPVQFDRLAAEIRAIQRELAEVVEVAESDDGLIVATVNARGDLMDLELDPRLFRHPDSKALSEAITGVYRSGRAAADARAFELTMRQLELTRKEIQK